MTIALNENCHYDNIEWSAAFTFNKAFKNIVVVCIVFKRRIFGIQASRTLYTWSAYHLLGNFGENCSSNGTDILFRAENRSGIELYHL